MHSALSYQISTNSGKRCLLRRKFYDGSYDAIAKACHLAVMWKILPRAQLLRRCKKKKYIYTGVFRVVRSSGKFVAVKQEKKLADGPTVSRRFGVVVCVLGLSLGLGGSWAASFSLQRTSTVLGRNLDNRNLCNLQRFFLVHSCSQKSHHGFTSFSFILMRI
jgi:hypothetical protein